MPRTLEERCLPLHSTASSRRTWTWLPKQPGLQEDSPGCQPRGRSRHQAGEHLKEAMQKTIRGESTLRSYTDVAGAITVFQDSRNVVVGLVIPGSSPLLPRCLPTMDQVYPVAEVVTDLTRQQGDTEAAVLRRPGRDHQPMTVINPSLDTDPNPPFLGLYTEEDMALKTLLQGVTVTDLNSTDLHAQVGAGVVPQPGAGRASHHLPQHHHQLHRGADRPRAGAPGLGRDRLPLPPEHPLRPDLR